MNPSEGYRYERDDAGKEHGDMMGFRFMAFTRGSKEPFEETGFEDHDLCLRHAEEWTSHLNDLDSVRLEAYILDEEGAIIWTYPGDLMETSFDTEVVNTGNSLSVVISKPAQLMGLNRGDRINVTLKRIGKERYRLANMCWTESIYIAKTLNNRTSKL